MEPNEGSVMESVTGKTQPGVKILGVQTWLTMGDGVCLIYV